MDIFLLIEAFSTYDHRVWKTGLPVRSAVLKPHAGRLVVGWVTTSESRLLYVFVFFFCERNRFAQQRLGVSKFLTQEVGESIHDCMPC